MGKNISTKLTLDNLAKVIKEHYAKKTELADTLKGAKLEDKSIKLYTDKAMTGAAAFTIDLPADMVLDLTKTKMVENFKWSSATYPGSTSPAPSLDGKPVLVMAVKGESDAVSYSFLSMEKLIDVYTEGESDGSATVTIDGYEISVDVNISTKPDNILQQDDDGSLYVPSPEGVDITGKADKKKPSSAGNLAGLDASGNLTDSGIASTDVITAADITDYSEEEIKSLLGIED